MLLSNRQEITDPSSHLSTGFLVGKEYSQSPCLRLGRLRLRSSVTDVDFLQRYRLRQLTRAVYDADARKWSDRQGEPEEADDTGNWDETGGSRARTPRVQDRRLLDYPAALGTIMACLLLLIVMVVRSAAWGVNPEPTHSAPILGTTQSPETTQSRDTAGQADADDPPQSTHTPPPGHRRRKEKEVEDGSQSTTAATITIHVEGAVVRPGIVTLTQGARIHEAIQAAGGATPEAALREINLARTLSDGEYLYMPHIDEDPLGIPAPARVSSASAGSPVSGGAPGASPGASAGGCVDINSADYGGLQALNGVGPTLAQRILDARQERGAFMSLDDVDTISGIGPTMLRKIEAQLCPLDGG